MSDKLVKTCKEVMLRKMNQNPMHTLNKFDDENKKDKIKVRILYNLYTCVSKHVFINICE